MSAVNEKLPMQMHVCEQHLKLFSSRQYCLRTVIDIPKQKLWGCQWNSIKCSEYSQSSQNGISLSNISV